MVEAFFLDYIAREVMRETLERYYAVELRVMGLVHHTHTALAELFENPVMGYCLAYHTRTSDTAVRIDQEQAQGYLPATPLGISAGGICKTGKVLFPR